MHVLIYFTSIRYHLFPGGKAESSARVKPAIMSKMPGMDTGELVVMSRVPAIIRIDPIMEINLLITILFTSFLLAEYALPKNV